MIELILISAILVGLAISSVSDIRSREVPDWLSYSMIFFGLGSRLIFSLSYLDFSYILEGALGFALFFMIGMAMFYTGQWGGGDTKLLMGIGALIGFSLDFSDVPAIISFFVNLLLVGAAYGLLWSVILAMKHRKKFAESFRKNHSSRKVVFSRRFILIASVAVLLPVFVINSLALKLSFVALAIIPVSTFYIWLFAKSVEQSCMFKKVSPNKLTEGDWIEAELRFGKKVLYSKKDLGVSKEQIALIKKHFKNKKVLVKEGIPFVPSFFVAYVVTLLFGAWFLVFI